MTICDTSERVHSTQSYSWINERGRHAQREKDEKRGGEKKDNESWNDRESADCSRYLERERKKNDAKVCRVIDRVDW